MNWKRALLLGAGITGIGAAAAFAADKVDGAEVGRLLKTRLPKTEVTSVDCTRIGDLCEVVAGKVLFYTDRAARYLVVGRVYDMETRQDLTAARLLEINPDQLVGGGAGARARVEAELPGAQAAAASQALPAMPGRLDLAGLSSAGAIVWGKPQGQTVTVFTDFRCGYCRALASTLEQMNVRVIERPISLLGSRDLANSVLCARDRARALRAAYAGEDLPPGTCDTTGLSENEGFARRHGMSGTPVIVREDGAVLEGFRPRAALEEWLRAAK